MRKYRGFAGAITAISISAISNTKCEYKYTIEEVRNNDGTNDKPMWVTYKDGVYDVTKFKDIHPGGRFIKQAAGGGVDEFWKKWSYHLESPKVEPILNELRIGSLTNFQISGINEEYVNEPKRVLEYHKTLIKEPYLSETTYTELNNLVVKNEALYVRNHAPVPRIDLEDHSLSFHNKSNDMHRNLTIVDLYQQYDIHSIHSVLQCAGNRASHDQASNGVNGFTGTLMEPIDVGMMGNIKWSGVSAADVLQSIYPRECLEELLQEEELYHVNFVGADEYETSTPLSYILDPLNDCLFVMKMNDVALTPDHGYPIRVLLPGVAGARCVKWLESVSISKKPSKSPWNRHYYLRKDGSHIQQLPLQSILLSGNRTELGVSVEGVAYSGGSSAYIEKVVVSVDGGVTWLPSELRRDEIQNDDSHGFHGWVRFVGFIPLAEKLAGDMDMDMDIEVICRAIDSDGTTQPEVSLQQHGYLYNGWSKMQF
mgnify:CR=1 FL=1